MGSLSIGVTIRDIRYTGCQNMKWNGSSTQDSTPAFARTVELYKSRCITGA